MTHGMGLRGRQMDGAQTPRDVHASRRLRLVVDAAMALVCLLQMAPYQTGGWYHEVSGLAFVGLLIFHHVLNARWLRVESGGAIGCRSCLMRPC